MTTFTTEDRILAEKDGSLTVNIEQRSNEWHQMRLGKVTASRVADILAKTKAGASASRQNYLIELALQRTTGVIQESYSNSAMEWGVEQEQFAAIAYEVAKETFVEKTGFWPHETIKWLGVSPDRLVGADGLVEIKCPNTQTHLEYVESRKPPMKYLQQMQFQMACTGRQWCDFVSFDPRAPEGLQLFVKRVKRDDAYILELEAEVKKFLEEMETRIEKLNKLKGNHG